MEKFCPRARHTHERKTDHSITTKGRSYWPRLKGVPSDRKLCENALRISFKCRSVSSGPVYTIVTNFVITRYGASES